MRDIHWVNAKYWEGDRRKRFSTLAYKRVPLKKRRGFEEHVWEEWKRALRNQLCYCYIHKKRKKKKQRLNNNKLCYIQIIIFTPYSISVPPNKVFIYRIKCVPLEKRRLWTWIIIILTTLYYSLCSLISRFFLFNFQQRFPFPTLFCPQNKQIAHKSLFFTLSKRGWIKRDDVHPASFCLVLILAVLFQNAFFETA